MWTVELDSRAAKELRKLDRHLQIRIVRFLRERIATSEDPRQLGRALRGQSVGLWRYRVGETYAGHSGSGIGSTTGMSTGR